MKHLHQELVEVYAFQSPKEGKSYCGDSYYFTATEDYFLSVLADGLGSGQYAYEASSAVADVVRNNANDDVETLMKSCNEVLMQKRGAAVAILKVNFKTKEFDYSCVGNIRFYLYTPKGKLIYPLPVTGYLSGRPQNFRTQRFSYERNSKFLLHSDGFKVKTSKSLLKGCKAIELIAKEMKNEQQQSKEDDSTCIIGSLH
ncbi:phosphoserine phosphatase RsbX [Heyndrickxia sporothermodurans]|nr:phosphoserine phosphatase RsbX [Heyndrickxia sporothermodurans]